MRSQYFLHMTTRRTNAHAVAHGLAHEAVDGAVGGLVAADRHDAHSGVVVGKAVGDAGAAADGAGEGDRAAPSLLQRCVLRWYQQRSQRTQVPSRSKPATNQPSLPQERPKGAPSAGWQSHRESGPR